MPPRKAKAPHRKGPAPAPSSTRRSADLERENRELRARLATAAPERVAALTSIAEEFNTLDLDRIAETAVRKIPAFAGARQASVFLYDYDTNALVLAASSHARPLPERLPVRLPARSPMERALSERRTLNIFGFGSFEKVHGVRLERAHPDQYSTETCLVVPLLTANYLVGVLNLADRERGAFDPIRDVPGIEHLARVLAMAVRNCRLFREIQSQAHTDMLTGLRNHRSFHEALRTEMHRAQRYGRPLGLVMIDIDAFKALNDHHGHQAGDLALAELGKVVTAALRREDIAARYGGDEIALILPETGATGCLSVVRRLLNAVRAHPFVHDGVHLPVTISMGLAQFQPQMTLARLVEEADAALYRAKQGGKNRIELAGGPELEA